MGTQNIDFSKSLGMASPGVENDGGPRGSILELSRASQLPYNKKIQKINQKYNIYFTIFYRIFSTTCLGSPLGSYGRYKSENLVLSQGLNGVTMDYRGLIGVRGCRTAY